MSVEDVVARLRARGYRCVRQGKEWRCQCCGHDGKDLNLALSQGDNGCVLVTCHSRGCSVEEVARGLGLSVADFGAPGRKSNGAEPHEPERIYPYRDEQGRTLFEVVREADKRFWQRLPGARTGGIGDVRRVLFGLPELLRTEPGDPVAICEGEKDCVNVAKLGVAATTNPHGAGRWRREYTEWLKRYLPGRQFLVLPDNDLPGMDHAEQVFQSLRRAGLDATLVCLPNLPAKGDVSDWIAAGGTREKLLELALPPPHPLDLKVLDGAELERAELPVPEALVPHLLYRGFSTLLAGDSKLGKSSLLLRAILAACCGGWWLDRDRRPENQLPESRILYLNFEDPLFLTRERAQKMMAPERLPASFLTMEPPYGFRFDQILDWLHGAHARLELDAVIIDPIAIAAEWEDETDNSEVARTFKAIQRLAAETQLAILSAHHVTKKPAERGLNIRGGSAIKANVLGFLVLEPDSDLFRLQGINKLVGHWDVTLDRSEDDYSWWIAETRAGSTATPQQRAKERAKADLYALIKDQPGVVTERLCELLGEPIRTCRRYLAELEEAKAIIRADLPRADGARGRPVAGWLVVP